MIKICFVCTGNTCRSVMAERIMKKRLKDLKVSDIKVSSRGLKANGENIAENAKKALKEFGASASNRKSVKLGKIDEHTIYVTMTDVQKAAIKSGQVISFSQLIGHEVADPYGGDLEKYVLCSMQLNEGVSELINKILKWRG